MADPAAEPISAIPGLPAEASARLLGLLCNEPAVREVWLYGSRAMGRHRPGSDIDLSLHHDLPDSLRRHVARVGRRLVPPP
jgi:predicted nucleotidyltransferase